MIASAVWSAEREHHRVQNVDIIQDIAFRGHNWIWKWNRQDRLKDKNINWGGRHSSVVSSAPTILHPWVQIPSTPSVLFQFLLLKLWWEKDDNKQKEAEIGPFLKKTIYYLLNKTMLFIYHLTPWTNFARKLEVLINDVRNSLYYMPPT